MKISLQSFGKKIKDNLNDLSGVDREEQESPLLTMLPALMHASIQPEGTVLSRLVDEITKQDRHSLVDHCLALMACAIAERENLTLYDYEDILTKCKELFDDEALSMRFQAKLHSALLSDYSTEQARANVLNNFRVFLAENTYSQKITKDFLDALYAALFDLSLQKQREKFNIPSRFFEEVELLFMEYDVQKQREKLLSQGKDMQSFFRFQGDFLPKIPKNLPLIDTLKRTTDNVPKNLFSFAKKQESDLPYEAELSKLQEYALCFRDTVVLEQISAFRNLLIPQDFRIVFLGEGKRGKSSLINALLGERILPTKAIIPETGTLAELYYSKENCYEIEWIDEQAYEELEKILYTEESNILLKRKFENLQKIFTNKELFENLQNITISKSEELSDFISADGLYTALIKKVRMGVNSENIPKGILIVDTPAINASDPFYHVLTHDEALRADCIVMLLDSRKPDSYSEIMALKELTKKGRAIKIIGVLTHPPEAHYERELAKQRALETLQEATREVESIELVDVFIFNPNIVLQTHEQNASLLAHVHKQNFDAEYLNFLAAITKIIKEDIHTSIFNERIETTYSHLVSFVESNKQELSKQYAKNLPSFEHVKFLASHSSRLVLATEKYAEHARSLVMTVVHDIETWRNKAERAILLLEERIVLHLSKAMRQHADSLGNNFAKEQEWQTFDEEESVAIVKSLLDDFMAEQREDLQAWETKIQLFNDNMQEITLECVEQIQKVSEEIHVLFTTNSKIDHVLVQTAAHMNRLTLFLGGAGTGLLASSGIFNALALGTATFAFLTTPIVIPTALLIGATAYALRSFANPQKRKEYFLQKKEAKVREFAKTISQDFSVQLEQIQNELFLAYAQAVHKSLAPALEIMASEAVNIHLYLQVIEKQQLSSQ